MRRLILFPCAGQTLVGTIDDAEKPVGLLIVSGGNEIRSGAHRGMAMLAAEVAGHGYPVFRYDRRGIGDSAGENNGFLHARDDLVAAVAAFRQERPALRTVVAFGNCDAASTLAIAGRDAGIDRLLLANPWTIDSPDLLPPRAAIRARYVAALKRPSEWRRLISGGVNMAKLASGLRKLLATPPEPALASGVVAAIAGWGSKARVVLASGDATAIAFADAARHNPAPLAITTIDTASHSFSHAADKRALSAAILELLRG